MKNTYSINGEVTTIHCQYKGEPVEVLISTSDLDKAFEMPNTWCIKAEKGIPKYCTAMYEGKKILLHRWLLEPPVDKVVDHISRNALDNTRTNMRIVDQRENMTNLSNNTSGHVGVTWHAKNQNWIPNIKVDGKRKHLGAFKDIKDAIQARKDAEKLYWG